ECCVPEQAESIPLLIANVPGHHAMHVFAPGGVLIDEAIGGGFVALVLGVEDDLQKLAYDVMILVVMDVQFTVLKSQLPVLQKEIPMHQLHCVVGLVAAGLVVLQHAQNSAGVNTAQLCVRVVALFVQRFGDEQRNQIGLHLFQSVGVILQGLVEIAAIFGLIDAQVVADFVPQRAIKIAVGSQFFRLFFSDRGREGAIGALKNARLAHDVGAQEDRAAIPARQIGFIRQNRGGVAAAGLAKVGNHVVDADGNVFAHPFVMVVRQ